jgi:hypothetical protein
MIYNIKTLESSSHDALPLQWKLAATQRQHILIKPPKVVDSIEGIFVMGLTGSIVYIGELRHPTIAQNGAQPSFNLLATSWILE